jgi:hypothetical protein
MIGVIGPEQICTALSNCHGILFSVGTPPCFVAVGAAWMVGLPRVLTGQQERSRRSDTVSFPDKEQRVANCSTIGASAKCPLVVPLMASGDLVFAVCVAYRIGQFILSVALRSHFSNMNNRSCVSSASASSNSLRIVVMSA